MVAFPVLTTRNDFSDVLEKLGVLNFRIPELSPGYLLQNLAELNAATLTKKAGSVFETPVRISYTM